MVFLDQRRLDSAHVHAERAKSYAVDDPYSLGWAMILQAEVLWEQYKLEEARSEALRAVEIFEKFGSSRGMRVCETFLELIKKRQDSLAASDQLREFIRMIPPPGVLFSNIWSRNQMKALVTASNPRNPTPRYPILSHRLSQRPSMQLLTIYVLPFVHLV